MQVNTSRSGGVWEAGWGVFGEGDEISPGEIVECRDCSG